MVTFHVGSRPARPRLETLNDLSERTRYGGILAAKGRRITSTATEDVLPSPVGDTSNAKGATLASAPGQAAAENGATSNDNDTPSADLLRGTPSAQNSWIIHVDGEAMVGAGRAPSAPPPGRTGRLSIASGRSLRSIWKAGPGNNTNSEQVSYRNDHSRGWPGSGSDLALVYYPMSSAHYVYTSHTVNHALAVILCFSAS